MNILYLILSVVLGVVLVETLFKSLSLSTRLMLAFSGAFLFSVTVLHLIPDVYIGHDHLPGLIILIGFLFQFLLDFLSHGIEHGHHHAEDMVPGHIPKAALIGLFLHAFFEGIPTDMLPHDHANNSFVIAVALHKIPVSMVLYLLFKELNIPVGRRMFFMLLFALSAPAGALIGARSSFLMDNAHLVMAFVAGIFLHVSTTILFESSKDHHFNIRKLLVVLLGAVLAWISVQH